MLKKFLHRALANIEDLSDLPVGFGFADHSMTSRSRGVSKFQRVSVFMGENI